MEKLLVENTWWTNYGAKINGGKFGRKCHFWYKKWVWRRAMNSLSRSVTFSPYLVNLSPFVLISTASDEAPPSSFDCLCRSRRRLSALLPLGCWLQWRRFVPITDFCIVQNWICLNWRLYLSILKNIFVFFSNVWGRASQQRRLVVGWSGGDLCRLRILLDDSSTTIVPRTTWVECPPRDTQLLFSFSIVNHISLTNSIVFISHF